MAHPRKVGHTHSLEPLWDQSRGECGSGQTRKRDLPSAGCQAWPHTLGSRSPAGEGKLSDYQMVRHDLMAAKMSLNGKKKHRVLLEVCCRIMRQKFQPE